MMNYYPQAAYPPQYTQYTPPTYAPYQAQQSYPFNSPQQQAPPSLNGKVVESEEIVRATEIPIGSYGVFPKGDMSCVFIKTWNNDGTTKVVTYKPVAQEKKEEKEEKDVFAEFDGIKKSISDLSRKIDSFGDNSLRKNGGRNEQH